MRVKSSAHRASEGWSTVRCGRVKLSNLQRSRSTAMPLMQSSAKSILIGGFVSAVLSTAISVGSNLVYNAIAEPALAAAIGIPFGCLGCLIWMTSGLVAVLHYTREHEVTLSRGEGVRVGALAGVVGILAAFLMVRALTMLGVLPTVEDVIGQMAENPALQEADLADMAQFYELIMGWGGLVVGLIFGPLLGLLGGMIGAAWFKKG